MSKHTTIRLPDDLLRQAKSKAAAEGRTLTSLIEQGLRQVVAQTARCSPVIPRVSSASGGFAAGYDFLNSPKIASLVQEMDDEEYIKRLENGFK